MHTVSPTHGTWLHKYDARLADAYLRLPLAAMVPNAIRIKTLQHTSTQRTWNDLWQTFLICTFSSAQPSGQDSALYRFQQSGSSLLRLDEAIAARSDSQWILSQLQGWGFRFPGRLVNIVECALPYFEAAGSADRLLAVQTRNVGPLQLFVDLARCPHSDADISRSSRFSAALASSGLYGVGHKQLRNVLVNTGLACNVVPIDSRWRAFLFRSLGIDTTAAQMQSRSTYLALEDLIRRALLLVQPARQDLANMAILDAIVFSLGEPFREGVNRRCWNHSACRALSDVSYSEGPSC